VNRLLPQLEVVLRAPADANFKSGFHLRGDRLEEAVLQVTTPWETDLGSHWLACDIAYDTLLATLARRDRLDASDHRDG
jgi:hypothetical protein